MSIINKDYSKNETVNGISMRINVKYLFIKN
jgi:hypothetical protein